MNKCTEHNKEFRGAGNKVIRINHELPWLRTIRKVRDSFNKNLVLQIASARIAAEEGLINCNDSPMCVTCHYWEVKDDEPMRQYGYCSDNSHYELKEYNETCMLWEPCVKPYSKEDSLL